MSTPNETGSEAILSHAIEWLRLFIEATGALLVCLGAITAICILLVKRSSSDFTTVRLTLAKYLVLALEFQLAADILSTTIAPTWDKIGKLSAIAVIRTLLNYFLVQEMKVERKEE